MTFSLMRDVTPFVPQLLTEVSERARGSTSRDQAVEEGYLTLEEGKGKQPLKVGTQLTTKDTQHPRRMNASTTPKGAPEILQFHTYIYIYIYIYI